MELSFQNNLKNLNELCFCTDDKVCEFCRKHTRDVIMQLHQDMMEMISHVPDERNDEKNS